MKKALIVNEAKKLLQSSPFDLAHDLFHHYCVWENVLTIVAVEDLIVDLEVLEIATWWHDYERGSTEHRQMVEVMKSVGCSQHEIQLVKDLINTHSYHDERSESLGAKVLFDADKIEYVNPGRSVWIAEGQVAGKINPKTVRAYGKALEERIDTVVHTLYFGISKQLFYNHLTLLLNYLSQFRSKYPFFLENVDIAQLRKAQKYLVGQL